MVENVEHLFNLYLSLSDDGKERFFQKIRQTNKTENDSVENALESTRFKDGERACPFCGGRHVLKNGRRKTGVQKYFCKECGKSFAQTANSIFKGTRKELDVWKKYVDCIINGLSIRKAAKICGIHRNTSFYWRHKILALLKNMAKEVVLEDKVESDEAFFAKSYKGNHKKGFFQMPRKAHKRGKSTGKRGVSSEQVCVPCAVDGKGLSISVATNAGHVSTAALNIAFKGKIKEKSIICTDSNSSYRLFSRDNGLKLIQIKPGKHSNGVFNIQHINNYHSVLKNFMVRFKGVSSKHLNNYLLWNNFVNISKGDVFEKQNILTNYLFEQYETITCRGILKKPAMPLLC